ncbi:hypothetical protein X801_10733 [Opisthorchis viverrini]|uniref:Uncharacterized protein n=2 Tax=Opisthorchis viverrini TaxID=6198 RepID=A0A1S8WGS7_OPIVI|nr:hypothetical protein T265_05715 [Opisthorchis viverrini]KER27180.1 hypothetical protein T265_05715 [Opisthorchis viverrini]OON13493.1 hypothetical protein X801_10733 [Opisthorchis viverrini]
MLISSRRRFDTVMGGLSSVARINCENALKYVVEKDKGKTLRFPRNYRTVFIMTDDWEFSRVQMRVSPTSPRVLRRTNKQHFEAVYDQLRIIAPKLTQEAPPDRRRLNLKEPVVFRHTWDDNKQMTGVISTPALTRPKGTGLNALVVMPDQAIESPSTYAFDC